MTYSAIGRSIGCLILGACVLAAILTLVPQPIQMVAFLVALPFESLLLAIATSGFKSPVDQRIAESH